jgi:tetratricopeptide (TPR) repeat protein
MRAIVCAIVLVGGTPAFGDAGRARRLFQEAQTKYNLLHFDEALRLFEQAYEERTDPVFLFNIAQCQRHLGRYELAAKSYRAYLTMRPDAPNRADVMARIEDMEKAAARAAEPSPATPPVEKETPPARPPPPALAPEAVAPTPAPAPVARHRPRTLLIAGATLTSVGGAALVGGLASGLVARSRSDSVSTDARNGAEFDQNKESVGLAAQNASYALYAVGGAAAIAGVVILVLESRQHRGERARLPIHVARAVMP